MSDPVRDAAEHHDAADRADRAHRQAVADWKSSVLRTPAELRRIIKQYLVDNATDHADALTDLVLGTETSRQVSNLTNAAIGYAITCGDAPQYRSPEEIEADEQEDRAEQRREARLERCEA